MIIFISGATLEINKYLNNPHIGQLITPQTGNKIRTDMLVAADNAAFSNWDELKFIKMLDKINRKNICWVASPDVVGNASATFDLYLKWYPEIKLKRKLPIALILQDGQNCFSFDKYPKFDAIFIGGTTKFKFSDTVYHWVEKAKKNNIWVHMGRVNSLKRMEYAIDIGCDSIDGSGFSKFPRTMIPSFLYKIESYKKNTVKLKEQPLFDMSSL